MKLARLYLGLTVTVLALLVPAGVAGAQTCVPATSICISGGPNPGSTIDYWRDRVSETVESTPGTVRWVVDPTVESLGYVEQVCTPGVRPICVDGIGETVRAYDAALCNAGVNGTYPYHTVRTCGW